MKDRIKILLIIDKLSTGGAQRQLQTLALHLDPERFKVAVLCLASTGTMAEKLKEKNIPVYETGLSRLYDPRASAVLLEIAKLVRRHSVDIVHTWMFNPNIIGPVAARLGAARAVVTSRRDTGFWQKHRHHRALALTGPLVDAVAGNSRAVLGASIRHEGLHPRKCVLIRNGIEIPEKPPRRSLKEKRLVVGTVGSLNPQKGHAFFIDVAAAVLTRRPDTIFRIMGDGPLHRGLEERIRSLGIGNAVEMPGETADVFAALAKMDVFFLPSKTEGFPNSLIEAFASGLPSVATRVGGTPEIITSPDLGTLVEYGAVRGAAEAIKRYLSDAGLRKVTGAAARESALERFNAKTMADSHADLYTRLVERKRS